MGPTQGIDFEGSSNGYIWTSIKYPAERLVTEILPSAPAGVGFTNRYQLWDVDCAGARVREVRTQLYIEGSRVGRTEALTLVLDTGVTSNWLAVTDVVNRSHVVKTFACALMPPGS
jgi:hypothetical protein